MTRILAAVAIVAVIAVGAFLIFGNSPEDDGSYRVRAIFDNAGFVIPGEDVKIAGVRVGQIDSIDVTRGLPGRRGARRSPSRATRTGSRTRAASCARRT